MPIYRGRTPKTWRVTIYHQGRQRERIVQGRRADAQREEARWLLALQSAAERASGPAPTFSDFCAGLYAPWAEDHLAPRTWTNRQYQLASLIDHLGELPLDRIAGESLTRYKRARLAEGVGASTINDDLKVLGAVYSLARELGYEVETPSVTRLTEAAKSRVSYWTASQVRDLYLATEREAPRIQPLVAILANTGARKGEAIALRWASVDFARGLIAIEPGHGWRPKSGRPREVPISTSLARLLGSLERTSEYVCGPRGGGRYAYWPQNAFDRARRAAGLSGGPHTLRHTYASHFLASVPDLWLLAQLLGHSHQRVTEIYAHLLPDHLERARDAVDFAPPAPRQNSGGNSGGD